MTIIVLLNELQWCRNSEGLVALTQHQHWLKYPSLELDSTGKLYDTNHGAKQYLPCISQQQPG